MNRKPIQNNSKPEPPTRTEKEVYSKALRLIKRHNNKSPVGKQLVVVKQACDGILPTVLIDFFYIPGSEDEKALGESTTVMTVTAFKNGEKTDKALEHDDFCHMMKYLENMVTAELPEIYKDGTVQPGYYESMYFKDCHKDWEKTLKCHRTFLIDTKDALRLAEVFISGTARAKFTECGVKELLVGLHVPNYHCITHYI